MHLMGRRRERATVELLARTEQGSDTIVLRISAQARIENPRDYSSKIVNELRALLIRGVEGRPDRRRENFYEIEGDSGTFYIHVSPVTANVMLLAWWAHHPDTRPDTRRMSSVPETA
jgi:hypothetical protein